MNAIIYARQSSGDEEESASIEAQINNCRDYAIKHGYNVLSIYTDLNISGRTYPDIPKAHIIADNDDDFIEYYKNEIKTAKKKYRTGLAKVITDISNHPDIIVIIDDNTRLARPHRNSQLGNYLAQTFKHIPIHFVKGGISNMYNTNDKIIRHVKDTIADDELNKMRTKSIQGMKMQKAKGMMNHGLVCIGIASAGNQKLRLTDQAPIVAELFDRYVNRNNTLMDCVRWMHTMIPNRTWGNSHIRRMLMRIEYCGKTYNDDGEIIDFLPMKGQEIITYEIWQKAYNKLMSNPNNGNRNYDIATIHPLSGLLNCGYCGKMLRSEASGTQFYYYNCGAKWEKHHAGNTSALISEKYRDSYAQKHHLNDEIDTETSILWFLKRFIKPFVIKAFIDAKREANEGNKYQIEIENIDIKLNKLKEQESEFINLKIDGVISSDNLKSSLSILNEKRINLRTERQNIINKMSISNDDINERYKLQIQCLYNNDKFDLSDAEYKALAKRVFKQIYVYKYHIRLVFNDNTPDLWIEKIQREKKTGFPQVEIRYDLNEKRLYLFILNHTFLTIKYKNPLHQISDMPADSLTAIWANKTNDMIVINVGHNDTINRYHAKGCNYLYSNLY